jgi:hypothetical protein
MPLQVRRAFRGGGRLLGKQFDSLIAFVEPFVSFVGAYLSTPIEI